MTCSECYVTSFAPHTAILSAIFQDQLRSQCHCPLWKVQFGPRTRQILTCVLSIATNGQLRTVVPPSFSKSPKASGETPLHVARVSPSSRARHCFDLLCFYCNILHLLANIFSGFCFQEVPDLKHIFLGQAWQFFIIKFWALWSCGTFSLMNNQPR